MMTALLQEYSLELIPSHHLHILQEKCLDSEVIFNNDDAIR